MSKKFFVMLIIALLFCAAGCSKAGNPATSVSGADTATESTTTEAQTAALQTVTTESATETTQEQHPLLPDLDEENEKILAKLNESGCCFEFNKKLYPAERVLYIEPLDLPIKINDHYWRRAGVAYDSETFIITLEEHDLRFAGRGTMSTEFGLYNFVTGEYTTIYELENIHDPITRGAFVIDNTTGEFMVLDNVTSNKDLAGMRLDYVNLSSGERKNLYTYKDGKYNFMYDTTILGRTIYFHRVSPDESTMLSLDIDTGEIKEIDTQSVMPQLYNGKLAYIKSYYPAESKIRLIGTDFPVTLGVFDDTVETISNVHGSFVTHADSDTFFLLTQIKRTDIMKENIPELFRDNPESRYPLYIITKYSPEKPEGEVILRARGGKNNVYVGSLEFNGRFLCWYTSGEDDYVIYDNELDVFLYFSDIDISEMPSHPFTNIRLLPDNHSGLIQIYRKDKLDEDGNWTWESPFNYKKCVLRFKPK